MTPVPKGNRENGYRAEKKMLVPKGNRENGYRREKMTPIPKGNSKEIQVPRRKLCG